MKNNKTTNSYKTTTSNIQKNLTTNTYRLRKVINGTKVDISFKNFTSAKNYLNMLMKSVSK